MMVKGYLPINLFVVTPSGPTKVLVPEELTHLIL
jgi:hypothetical protein